MDSFGLHVGRMCRLRGVKHSKVNALPIYPDACPELAVQLVDAQDAERVCALRARLILRVDRGMHIPKIRNPIVIADSVDVIDGI